MIEKCQVFTPEKNVEELLDAVNYQKNLYNKRVIENACGDGNILKEIVRRYIIDSLSKNKSINDIKIGLEKNIYGAEINKVHHTNCIRNLNEVSALFGIENVKWNILNSDFLKQSFKFKFDYIIGNPPYISHRDLDNETRSYLKKNFLSCRYGKFDYCYAFIEASISCLKKSGKLAYLIPSSIFKNVFAKELRSIILPHTTKIVDYTIEKLFKKALTSSAILVCEKESLSEHLEYQDVANKRIFNIQKSNLTEKWIFTDQILQYEPEKRFGDYFFAANSIATLLNKAYLIKNFEEDKNYIIVDGFKIEKEIVKTGVSPRSLNYNKKELIIFPYQYEENTLLRYESKEFEKKFPNAKEYLSRFMEDLNERKSDQGAEWFEYGRTQALAHLNQSKLLISTVITTEVKVYSLSKESIPYSGIYIIPKRDLSLEEAKSILESEAFFQYICKIGINANGSSLRITSVDINNYKFI